MISQLSCVCSCQITFQSTVFDENWQFHQNYCENELDGSKPALFGQKKSDKTARNIILPWCENKLCTYTHERTSTRAGTRTRTHQITHNVQKQIELIFKTFR